MRGNAGRRQTCIAIYRPEDRVKREIIRCVLFEPWPRGIAGDVGTIRFAVCPNGPAFDRAPRNCRALN